MTPLDRERAQVLAAGRAARGGLAGVLLGLDSVHLDGAPTRRHDVDPTHVIVVEGVPCTDAWQTLLDLAAQLDDDTWEQALGVFVELDGQHHEGQPVYDASRQTAVVAATGWLVVRFTWREVTRTPKSCARRLTMLVQRLAA